MNVYFISGLGANGSVFKYIQLPEGYAKKHLDWIEPKTKETLGSYAVRLADNIDTHSPYALVGLSFGGMLAAEISRHFSPVHTVLISSVPDYSQLPGYYKLAGNSGIHQVFPWSLVKQASVIKHLFSAKSTEDKKMIASMINDTDAAFIKWAIEAILQWRSPAPISHFTHIHGSKDIILPIRYTRPSHVIEGGDHLLVFNHADTINRIIQEVLN